MTAQAKRAGTEAQIMSKNYERVKRWYDLGKWPKEAVRNAVVKGWITAEEYEEITGEEYDNG